LKRHEKKGKIMNRPITMPIEKLRKAAPMRHPGYMEACLRRGQLSGDGREITFTPQDYMELKRLFNPKLVATPPPPPGGCC
jgi:hypothetical protein